MKRATPKDRLEGQRVYLPLERGPGRAPSLNPAPRHELIVDRVEFERPAVEEAPAYPYFVVPQVVPRWPLSY